nr:substrate-binding domain-containing protein [Ideonella sp. A 288]
MLPLRHQRLRIYRDTGVVLTRKGKTEPQAAAFVEYLKSAEGQKIFARWGWDARRAANVSSAQPVGR